MKYRVKKLYILVRFKYALPVLGISICLIELGYPVFIWIKKTRFFWLVCILAMHDAIGLTMGMYLFALVMIVLNLAAFGVGIRVPWRPAGGTRTQFYVLPKTGNARESRHHFPDRPKAARNCFLKNFKFFENFVPQIPDR